MDALKLVLGVGLNDVPGSSSPRGNKKTYAIYMVWFSMLSRCYSPSVHAKQPQYVGCEVCDDWKVFSRFYEWASSRWRDGLALDKDILISGNRLYSPDACVFVPQALNNFFLDHGAERLGMLPGVSVRADSGKYRARCMNPFDGKREHLGHFDGEMEAHLAWRARKHELACQWADRIDDERIKAALRTRFAHTPECEMA